MGNVKSFMKTDFTKSQDKELYRNRELRRMKCRMQYFTSLAIISVTLLVRSPASAMGQLQCQVCGCPEGGQGLSPEQCSGQCKGQRQFQKDSM